MIEFWFEFASTYSYPAAMRIERLSEEAGLPIVWKPFLLGPLFHEQQGLTDSPFNAVPVKGKYMWRDMERICAAEGLALKRPHVFPQNGLKAARITLALPETARPDFVKAVYTANFAEQADISADDTLTAILQRLGHDPVAILQAASEEAIKTELKSNTSEAARRGIFGSPTFLAPDGEMFWGNDRLEQAVAWARKSSPQPTALKVTSP